MADLVGRPVTDIMPSNSIKSREALAVKKPDIKKREDVKFTVKKNPWKSFVRNLFVDDRATIGEYITKDVILPSIRKLIYDMGSGALEMALYGSVSSAKRNGNGGTKVSYNSFYQNGGGQKRQEPVVTGNAPSWRDICFNTRPDAEEILFDLVAILEDYPSVSVANLNEMLGISGQHTDVNWGWTDLSGATTKMTRDGYFLDLPKPKPL